MSIFTKSLTNKIDLELKRNMIITVIILITVLIIFSIISLIVGSSSITIRDVIDYFTFQEVSDKVIIIMKNIRVPRLLSGLIVGSSLALAGFILQVVLNNSLASPSTIGVNAGAALFVVFGASIFATIHPNIWAFLGSLFVVMLVVAISYVTNTSRITIILTGITISTICNALVDFIIIFNPDVIFDKTAFYIGGLSTTSRSEIIYAIPFIIVAYILIFAFRNSFSTLVLGDEIAHSLGVNVKRTRIIAIVVVALLASISTTLAGLIGFIGIIIPHIVRRLFHGDVKILLVITGLFGANFLVMADLIGRLVISPYEIPVGVVMSLIGGPFFIYLLLTSNKRGKLL